MNQPIYESIYKICCSCLQSFVLESGEREYFARNGLHEPRRCKPCRDAKRIRDRAFTRPLTVTYGD